MPEIRLIDADGTQKGVVGTPEAMSMAEEADLDLVEVAPEAKPPVCRIMDYGKYRFDKEKKAKETKLQEPLGTNLPRQTPPRGYPRHQGNHF